MGLSAIVVGATGLVGTSLVEQLLADPKVHEVRVITRRELPLINPKLRQIRSDFNNLELLRPELAGDAWFCCLGTTIDKAKSQAAFRQVDFELPLQLAKLASEAGTKRALVVTALGSNPKSSIFYNRTKGELEQALTALPFESLALFRPSLLTGQRAERRKGEKWATCFATTFAFLFIGPLDKYRAIPAETVARAMKYCALNPKPGLQIIASNLIRKIALEDV